MECLLAYIELTQFQQYIIAQNKDNDKIQEETLKKLKMIIFPSSIPMSKIVGEDITLFKFNNLKNHAYEYKLKAHKLFNKYIKIGSEFEINLSYQQRNSWMGMMSTTSNLWSFMHIKVDLNELLLLIEQCKLTMTKLLDHSLTRFKTYAKFEEVEQIFNSSNPIITMTPKFLAQKNQDHPSTLNLMAGNNNNRQHISQNSTQSRLSVILHKLPHMRPSKSLSKSTSVSGLISCDEAGNETDKEIAVKTSKDTKCEQEEMTNNNQPNETKQQQLHILHIKEKTPSASIEIVINDQPSDFKEEEEEEEEEQEMEMKNNNNKENKQSNMNDNNKSVMQEIEHESSKSMNDKSINGVYIVKDNSYGEMDENTMTNTTTTISPKYTQETQSVKSVVSVPSMISVQSIPSMTSNDSIDGNNQCSQQDNYQPDIYN